MSLKGPTLHVYILLMPLQYFNFCFLLKMYSLQLGGKCLVEGVYFALIYRPELYVIYYMPFRVKSDSNLLDEYKNKLLLNDVDILHMCERTYI